MKKQLIIPLVFLFFGLSGQGQTDVPLQVLIEEMNELLEQYEPLYPLGEYHTLEGFDISKEDISAILAYNETAIRNDSIEIYELIGHLQGKILTHLESIIYHKDFLKINLEESLKGDALSVVQSDDRKLFNFSLDEKTGGTYRSRISIMHYVEDSPKPGKIADVLEEEEENPMFSIFHNDGYGEIKTLNTEEGVKYLLFGYVRGCSYCFEEHVSLVKLEEGAFVEEFSYGINFRDWETASLSYDEKTQTINAEYVTDDLTTECNCMEVDLRANEDEEEPREIKCECVFRFNGKSFELIRACAEINE